MRLVLLLLLAPALAMAQVPNVSRLARGTTLSPLPTDVGDYWAGVVLDQANNCPRFSIDGQTWLPCSATSTQLAAAITGEQTARTAAIAAATAPLATTTAVNAAIASATSGLASSSTVVALTTRVATLESQVATLQAQVATLQAYSPPFIPGTAVASGLSIPILGVQTSPVTSTVTGAKVGADCRVGTLGFGLVGATGICEVTAANTVTTRWVSNTGALSALLSIPNGTYPLRVERLP